MSARPMRRSRPRRWLPAAAVVAALVLGAGLLGYSWTNRTKLLLSEQCTAHAGNYSGALEPDQSGSAALIAAIAVKRGLPARAATIAIATAMQESKLRNIAYGDRDSLGLFQQRPSQGWGTREQIQDAHYATNAFYDALVKVSGYQSMSVTQAAQKVQRSAFPDAYAFHESTARAFAANIYGQGAAGLACELNPVGPARSAQADQAGFAARPAKLVATATAEFGALPAQPAQAGTAVKISFGNPARAWGFAQWAVASAHRLEVSTVAVDNQQWQRKDSISKWQDSGTALGATTVLISLP